MKNTFTSPADFWQERDFGAKISAAFDFIGAHWRPLGKCLVYFVLPGTLLMGIGLGIFTNTMFNFTGHAVAAQRAGVVPRAANPFDQFGAAGFSGLGLAMLGGLLAFLLLVGTVHGYVRARLRLPAAVPVTPREVWAELRARLGRMLAIIGLLVGGYVALVVGVLVLVGGAVGIGKLLGTGSSGLAWGFLLIPVLYFLIIYASIAMSLFFPVLWFEDRGVFASVGRCFQLIRGRWWATFGLILVATFLQSMLAVVFAIPQYAVTFGKMLQVPGLGSDVLGLIAQCFYAVGIVITYTLPMLALVFQYFNLVEKREGRGLRLLVDQLGQPQAAPVAQSGYYRPEEEGEY
ncbi:hypothetical protein QMK33_07965 [Hymenobacter sp. H14-R3]|uniref:hypothetical protein n=1 Tax=Hymenobacter sp. H14-R3 TaxID=3046308 RepID=UPI0024B9CB3B|nr:hypothetical protein [Hymenobacter sp. H14-R3]MDJ0365085.1 hypothetical protein [Hymenobacter sp. H14-R3]